MTTSAGAAMLDYLFATISAKVTPTDGSAQVFVSDGPPVTADVEVFTQRIGVGYNPLDPAGVGVESAQAFGELGDQGRTRYETLTATCSAETWTGDTSAVKTARDALYSLVAQVELLLRGTGSDMTLGGAVLFSQFTRTATRQTQDENGFSVLMVFDITATARLTAT